MLYAASETEKREWINHINMCIKHELDKSNIFTKSKKKKKQKSKQPIFFANKHHEKRFTFPF